MIQQILRVFDLNKKEEKAFNSVRELGTQPASNIARVTGIPRNSVRFILDGLVEKGLLVKNMRGNTQFYTVERAENIIRHLKVRQTRMNDKFDTQIKLVKDFGAEINPHSRTTARKPKITFYEGSDGLEKVYEHTLSAKNGIKSWASFEGMHGTLPQYFETYYKRRAKKRVFIESIHPDSEISRERQKHDKEEWRDSALVSPTKCNWIPEIQVYDNFVNIASWHEKLGILIESPEIAQAMKSIFDLSFEAAKNDQGKRDDEDSEGEKE